MGTRLWSEQWWGTSMYAEERAGTLKRELNKTQMSVLLPYSRRTAVKGNATYLVSGLKEIMKLSA